MNVDRSNIRFWLGALNTGGEKLNISESEEKLQDRHLNFFSTPHRLMIALDRNFENLFLGS